MVSHRGFSAWIYSGGHRLPEYEVKMDHKSNTVTCWVPCEFDQKFSVCWEDHGSGIDSAGFVILDGHTIPGQFLYGCGTAQRHSMRTSDQVERPFVFSKAHSRIRHVSDKDLGTIVLKIKQIRRKEMTHPPNAPMLVPPPTRAKVVDMVPAYVSYGSPQHTEMQEPTTWVCEPYDPAHPGSIVYFCFRYRPVDFLVSQGIMPGEMDWETSTQQSTPVATPRDAPALSHRGHLFDPVKTPTSVPLTIQSPYTHLSGSNESTPKSSHRSLPDTNRHSSPGPREGPNSQSSASHAFHPYKRVAPAAVVSLPSNAKAVRSVSTRYTSINPGESVLPVRRCRSYGEGHKHA